VQVREILQSLIERRDLSEELTQEALKVVPALQQKGTWEGCLIL